MFIIVAQLPDMQDIVLPYGHGLGLHLVWNLKVPPLGTYWPLPQHLYLPDIRSYADDLLLRV